MKLASRIVSLREAHEISQTNFANRLGMNRSVVNRIEKGTRPVRDDELKAIAQFFDVSVDYLLDNEESRASEMSYMSEEEIQLIKIYRKIPEDKRLHAINIFRTVVASFVGS